MTRTQINGQRRKVSFQNKISNSLPITNLSPEAIKSLTLTVDDIMVLEKQTKFKENEIKRWFK